MANEDLLLRQPHRYDDRQHKCDGRKSAKGVVLEIKQHVSAEKQKHLRNHQTHRIGL